jgi:hypothetical protein
MPALPKSTILKKTLLLFLVLSVFAPRCSHAQYCTGGPTSAIDSNVESVQLTGATQSITHTGCPGIFGLEDLTTLCADLIGGNAYTLTVKFGTCGNNYNSAGEV